MRLILVLLATTSVAACGGSGPTTVGSSAVTGAAATATPTSPHSFVTPTDPKTYTTIGGFHTFDYATDSRNFKSQYEQTYTPHASTARDSGTTVTYNPRDAIFELAMNEPLSAISQTLRFQDPLHRTDFGGARYPQSGVPDLTSKGVAYLQAGGDAGTPGTDGYRLDISTFFYQVPGTNTKYVTFGGYLRNQISTAEVTDTTAPVVTGVPAPKYLKNYYLLSRGAFVYGERTVASGVPRTGTGTFDGDMIATMVHNADRDVIITAPTYFQWISGTATTKVDFAANTFTIDLRGKVDAPVFSSVIGGRPPIDEYTSKYFTILGGSDFVAKGAGRIDLVNAGGFLGSINSAAYVLPDTTRVNLTVAGSSVNGSFFGPTAQEIGGGFGITGGVPDERVDILGAFTGKRP